MAEAGGKHADRTRARFGSAGRRIGVVTIDQALSGGSNLLTILLVAHLLSPEDFGRFSIFFLIYSVANTSLRALISGPILVHPRDVDTRSDEVLGSALVAALLTAAACLAVGVVLFFWSPSLGLGCIVLAALLPLLLLQDVGRFMSWAVRRPGRSVVLDAVWVVLEVAAFAACISRGWDLTLIGCILIWGISGAVAGGLTLVQFGRFSRAMFHLGWLRAHWTFSWKYLASTLVTQLAVLVGVGLIAGLSSPAAVAAVRAVTLLTRPGFTVKNAVGQSIATDVARDNPGGADLWAHVWRGIGITTLIAVVNTAVLMLLDDRSGSAVLGNTWPLAAALVLPAGLQLVMETLSTGTRESIIAHREIDVVLLIDSLGSVLWVLAAGIGAVVGDASGVVWAGVLAEALRAIVWWGVFLRRVPRWNADRPRATPSAHSVKPVVT